MIALAVVASHPTEVSNSSDGNSGDVQRSQIRLYREITAQCLILGEYTKPGPYVLETLVNYTYIEMRFHADSSRDIWYLTGLEVLTAKRMGYHRDPSHFPGLSPLQGEMRRRLWVTVMLGDFLISSQMGMPRMISDWQCDTAEPRNLYDDDLDASTAATGLPPSRPETEHTHSLDVIARRRLLVALGKISDLTIAVRPCSYAEAMRADAALHAAVATIPPSLRMRPMAASITDSQQVIMSRLFMGHMVEKGRILLHRRYLHTKSPAADRDAFAYSRRACLDASLRMLEIQHIMDEETRPGGLLSTMAWRQTSIMQHSFLTATMILCSLLHVGKTQQRGEEIEAALRRTREIWMRNSAASREAKKGAETVSIILARAGDGRGHHPHADGKSGSPTGTPGENEAGMSMGLDPGGIFQGNIDGYDGMFQLL